MTDKIDSKLIEQLTAQANPYELSDSELAGFSVRVRPSGKATYYYCYRFNGRKRSYKIGGTDRLKPAEARKSAVQLAGDVARGICPQTRRNEQRQEASRKQLSTLRSFATGPFRDHLYSRCKQPKHTTYLLEHYFGHLYDKQLDEINEWVIGNWIKSQKLNGLKEGGINRPLRALKSLLNKAVSLGVIDRSPLAKLKPLKEDKYAKPRFLSDADERALRLALAIREQRRRAKRARMNQWRTQRRQPCLPDLSGVMYCDYLMPMVLIALNTGMRKGELLNLTWEDVNSERRFLTVRGGGAKSGHSRTIPLSAEAAAVLAAWRQQGKVQGLVFPSPKTNRRMTNIDSSWADLKKEAKLENFRFHDLRHTFASKLVMRGVDLNTVRVLLGHADISMTLRYSHLSEDHVSNAVALLDGPTPILPSASVHGREANDGEASDAETSHEHKAVARVVQFG